MLARAASIFLAFTLTANFLGCGEDSPAVKTPQPKARRNGKVFQYPFGVFWGQGTESPRIDSAQIEHIDVECPLVWIGEEAIDFSQENAETLKQKYGEKLTDPPNGRGFDLTAVTKFKCIALVDERGAITDVYLYLQDEHAPCLTRTRDSERLCLPCIVADVERCFGAPVRVTEF